MCVVDPLHNLLLGTAKLMVEHWFSLGVLSFADFEVLQTREWTVLCLSVMLVECPTKFCHFFLVSQQSSVRMDNFLLPYALKGILPWKHCDCWLMFVKACPLGVLARTS